MGSTRFWRRRLRDWKQSGLGIGALKRADRHVEGVMEMMLDATRRYDHPLTAERLFAWHASLFPPAASA